MKVVYAPNVLAAYDARKEAAQLLAGGETVVVKGAEAPVPAISPELSRTILLGQGAIAPVPLSPAPAVKLNAQGIAVGAGAGAAFGLGAGMVLQSMKHTHPVSATIVEAVYALAGSALMGAGLGAAVGSGYFKVTPHFENGAISGVAIEPTIPKTT